mgnify:CR=1 FL=1
MHSLTVYVGDTTGYTGHMWFSITDGVNTYEYGYGSAIHTTDSDVISSDAVEQSGEVHYDLTSILSNYTEVSSFDFEISLVQFNSVKDFVIGTAFNAVPDDNTEEVLTTYTVDQYSYLDNNCVSFTWDALGAAGLNPYNINGNYLLPSDNISNLHDLDIFKQSFDLLRAVDGNITPETYDYIFNSLAINDININSKLDALSQFLLTTLGADLEDVAEVLSFYTNVLSEEGAGFNNFYINTLEPFLAQDKFILFADNDIVMSYMRDLYFDLDLYKKSNPEMQESSSILSKILGLSSLDQSDIFNKIYTGADYSELKSEYKYLSIVDSLSLVNYALDSSPRGYAFRYALESLSPFAVVDNNPESTLYDIHNQNGELNAENFTEEYLKDKGDMLYTKNVAYQNNADEVATSGDYSTDYRDLTSGVVIAKNSTSLLDPFEDNIQIVFGSNQGEPITGGARQDRLYGRAGDDAINGLAGNDYIEGGKGNDTINGGDDNDTLLGQDGIDVINGGEGVDTISGGKGDDTVHGDGNIDYINGNEGSDHLYGDAGEDIISGGDDNDWLFGGADADHLMGGKGGDTIHGNSLLDRSGVGDTFIGGEGDDILFGTEGADTYIFNLGDGIDTINEVQGSLVDILNFKGVSAEDIRITNDNGDIFLTHVNGIDQVKISGITEDSQFTVKFDGVTTWFTQDLFTDMSNVFIGTGLDESISSNTNGSVSESDFIYGLSGYDNLYGNNGDDFIFGGDGEDHIYGGYGFDTLSGGQGDDILKGTQNSAVYTYYPDYHYQDTAGNIFIGGLDNDLLYGNQHGDTYMFASGDGQDVIYEWNHSDLGEDDSLIISGFSLDEFNVNYYGNSLVISSGTDKITIDNWFSDSTYQIESITHDGGVFTAAQLTQLALVYHIPEIGGYSGGLSGHNVTIHGSNFTDNINGSSGDDTVYGNAGDDIINGNGGDDILDGGADNDTISGNYGFDTLIGGSGNDILFGTRDTYYGSYRSRTYYSDTAGNDFTGGLDNDTLYGNQYGDTYNFAAGDGMDTIIEWSRSDMGEADVLKLTGMTINQDTVNHIGNNLVISNGVDSVTIQNWYGGTTYQLESVIADGVSYTTEQISDFGTTLIGDDLSNNLYSVSGYDNKLFGHGGDDYLAGSTGDDILIGGSGQDILYGGAGDDTLMGGEGNVILTPALHVEQTANDTAGNEFKGGTGDDTIYGSLYADTYLYTKGDGSDTIIDQGGNLAENDVLDFTGITKTDLWFDHVEDDLEITVISTGDKVTVDGWYASETNQLETIKIKTVSAYGRTLSSGNLNNEEVETLVDAMAPYTAPTLGQTIDSLGLTGVLSPVIDQVY